MDCKGNTSSCSKETYFIQIAKYVQKLPQLVLSMLNSNYNDYLQVQDVVCTCVTSLTMHICT